MRIVLLGNHQVSYSSETHHKKSLEALGHEVIALQETQASSQEIFKEASKSDLFIWIKTHGWQTPGKPTMDKVLDLLKEQGIPTVSYHLDLWLGLEREKELVEDPIYKHIQWFFTVDKKMAEWFNKNTEVKGRFLPAGVFHEECFLKLRATEPENDIIFVGSKGYHPEWPWRPQLIDWLAKTYGDKFKHYGGDGLGVVRELELTELYNNSKIAIGDTLCLNFDYPYYFSDRLYETIGRGGFTIFPYIKGLEDEFDILPNYTKDEEHEDDNIELVTYKFGDFKQLKDKIDYYLKNPKKREDIRRRGFEKVINNYTYKHRWQTIIDEVMNE